MKNLKKPYSLPFLIIVLFCCFLSLSLSAQITDKSYSVISGFIVDKTNGDPLIYANISVPNTNIGMVTNSDGKFLLKIPDSLAVKEILISHVGYKGFTLSFPKEGVLGIRIELAPTSTMLKEVLVLMPEARKILDKAISKIGDNYSNTNNMLTGFYRETIKKRNHYISISEAVVGLYKQKYTSAGYGDRTEVYKGRRILSQKKNDTIVIKLEGGPNLAIYADIIKNRDLLLSPDMLDMYNYSFEKIIYIDKRPQYIISFVPRFKSPFALYIGELYIDKENLTITRAIFHLDMEDKNKATNIILKNKTRRLRFYPLNLDFIVTYETGNDGRTHLRYVRNEINFRCDLKRHLFATKYSITSEMVITDYKKTDRRIPWSRTFRSYNSLTEKVEDFADPDFWKEYNILEPTERLDKAVDRLKKK